MIALKKRKFGCEWEFSSEYDDMLKPVHSVIRSVYGRRYVYSRKDYHDSQKNKWWHLKTDSTTKTELCTPISTFKDMPKIKAVLRGLAKHSPEITDNDSFHVHVQASDVPLDRLLIAWLDIEHVVIKCFPAHRRNNDYCERLISYDGNVRNIASFLEDARSSADSHHAIFSSAYYDERGTIEFRVGEGNVDWRIARNWILFCLSVIRYAEALDPIDVLCRSAYNRRYAMSDMIEAMELRDKQLIRWLVDRYGSA